MAIETVPHIPANYTYLFEIGDRIQESQNLEIDEIILRVCDKDRKNQWGRKIAFLNSRMINQEAQNKISNEKASAFRQTLGVYLEGAAVACHVASAMFGGATNPAGGTLTAIGQAFSSGSTYQDKLMRAQEEVLNHNYQRTRDLVNDYNQQMQSADKENEQDTNVIDRMTQNSRRQTEILLGG